MMDLKKQFNTLTNIRDQWLIEAEETSYLTIPSIRVRSYAGFGSSNIITNNHGSRSDSRSGSSQDSTKPHSSSGRNGINNLTNTLLTLLFPTSINWYRLTLGADEKKALIADPTNPFEDSDSIDEVLLSLEERINNKQNMHLLRSKLHALFKRNLIEGNNVINLYRDEDGNEGLRIIPMRDFVVERVNGDVSKLYLRGVTTLDNGQEAEVYTCVDYRKKEVLRQIIGGKHKTPQLMKKDKPSYYIVVTSTMPTVEDYAESYAHELIGDLKLANSLTESIDRAYAIYSTTILVNDQDESGLSVYDLADLRPGEAVEGKVTADGRAAGIGFVSAANKPSETAVAAQWLERVENKLHQEFGGGVSNLFGTFVQPRSATEIATVSAELERFVSGLGQLYHAVLLQPLAQAYLDFVVGKDGATEQETLIIPQIIAGSTQLSRLQELSALTQIITTQLTNNPQFGDIIKWRVVWQRMTNALGIDTSGLLKSEEEIQAEQQAQLQQLAQLQQAQQQQQDPILQQQQQASNQLDIANDQQRLRNAGGAI